LPAYPSLTTERLLLTLPSGSAAERLVTYATKNREFHEQWSPDRPTDYFTAAFWRRQLEAARAEYLQRQGARFVLFYRDRPDGPVVGQCTFSNLTRGPLQACYLGYHLDRDAIGRGLMHEALRAAIPFVLRDLQLHRVAAAYMPTNEKSGRLLRRLGFTVEGYARDYLFLNGAWRDHVLTAFVDPQAPPPCP
jgi:ribosomal-protein-alanine N-acetyltransferase